MAKVLKVVGMERTTDGGSVAVTDPIVASLAALETEIQSAFGERTKGGRKGEFGQSNAINLMKMIWSKWCGTDIQSTHASKRVNGKPTRIYTLEIPSCGLWNALTDRRHEGWMGRDGEIGAD